MYSHNLNEIAVIVDNTLKKDVMLFLLFNGMKKQNTDSQTNAPYQDCTMNGTTWYGEKILIRQKQHLGRNGSFGNISS